MRMNAHSMQNTAAHTYLSVFLPRRALWQAQKVNNAWPCPVLQNGNDNHNTSKISRHEHIHQPCVNCLLCCHGALEVVVGGEGGVCVQSVAGLIKDD